MASTHPPIEYVGKMKHSLFQKVVAEDSAIGRVETFAQLSSVCKPTLFRKFTMEAQRPLSFLGYISECTDNVLIISKGYIVFTRVIAYGADHQASLLFVPFYR